MSSLLPNKIPALCCLIFSVVAVVVVVDVVVDIVVVVVVVTRHSSVQSLIIEGRLDHGQPRAFSFSMVIHTW